MQKPFFHVEPNFFWLNRFEWPKIMMLIKTQTQLFIVFISFVLQTRNKIAFQFPLSVNLTFPPLSFSSALICSQQQFEADRKYVLTLQECSLAPLSCGIIATVKTYTYQTACSSNPFSVQFKVHCFWMCSQLLENSGCDMLSWWENFGHSMLRWWPWQLDNLINVPVLCKLLSTCFRCCVRSYSQKQQLHWQLSWGSF